MKLNLIKLNINKNETLKLVNFFILNKILTQINMNKKEKKLGAKNKLKM